MIYLGVLLSVDFTKIGQNNITPIVNSMKNTLAHWSKLKISWRSRVAANKMMILP